MFARPRASYNCPFPNYAGATNYYWKPEGLPLAGGSGFLISIFLETAIVRVGSSF